MPRKLTLERQALKQQALVLRKMGWSQDRIADEIGVPQQVVSYWLTNNDVAAIVGKRHRFTKYATRPIVGKPQFLSWCGKVENFSPAISVSFDLVIADPPWNISKPNTEIPRYHRRTNVKKHFGFEDSRSDDAYLQDVGHWLKRLYELAGTPSWCWFWCSYRYLSLVAGVAESVGWDVHNWFLWVKTNPAPLLGANNFLQAIEPALIMRKGKASLRFDDGHLPNFFMSPQVPTGDRIKDFEGNTINLAQKPVPLLSQIVIWCSDPGEWVLDAFAGSGSASLSALKNGRNCCAVDTDEAQLTIVKGRLQKAGVI